MKLLLLILVFLFITRSLILGAFSAIKQLKASLQIRGEDYRFSSPHDRPGARTSVPKKDVVITLSAQDVKVTEE